MADEKDIKRSFCRYAIFATVVAVIFLFVKKDNVLRWVQAGILESRQEKHIEFLERENARLDNEIRLLSTDRDSLEKFARESFGFSEPGDDVYIEE